MLNRHEVSAFLLAAATAPVATCVAFGSTRLFVFVAGIAYIAAFTVGLPCFAYLRHRGWALASRSLVSGAIAGLIAAGLLMTLVFGAFPPRHFMTDPEPTLSLLAIAIGWG